MNGCPDCAQLTGGDCGKHPPVITPDPTVFSLEPPMGWRCPCCRAVYAPGIVECWRCSPPVLPTYNGGHECAPSGEVAIDRDNARIAAERRAEDLGRLLEQIGAMLSIETSRRYVVPQTQKLLLEIGETIRKALDASSRTEPEEPR